MCKGFGLIVTNDLKAYFVEPDQEGNVSHSEILIRLNLADNTNQFIRRFVRVEFSDWTADSFKFDEDNTVPGWADNNSAEIQAICIAVLNKCAPARAEYEKVCAPARAEYEKVRDTAWAEYEKVRDTAWAEYEKVRDTARAEYEKVRAPARAEYEKVCAPARAEYEKVCAPARAEMISELAKISGYVAKG